MTQINWIPEEHADAGGFEAAGFLKLLGVPKLHNVELLVRETAQNSWDARAGKSSVEMEYRGVSVAKGNPTHQALVQEFFTNKPKREIFPALISSLGKDVLPLLIIRDSGTKGLGGVTNARIVGSPNSTNRYRRFLLNIGEQGYTELGGGAYGYGRSICFSASHSHTAIIYSRTKDDLPDYESRLIGVGYGNQFGRKNINHNGRHWWTASERPGSPITGKSADSLAQRIGIQPYGSRESGTAIVIIDPNAGIDLEDTMNAIALSIEMHLWPKYVNLSNFGRPAQMKFSVKFNDRRIAIRNPEEVEPLKHYIRAFTSAYTRNQERLTDRDTLDPGLKHAALFLRADSRTNPIGQLSVSSFPKMTAMNQRRDESETSYMHEKMSHLTRHVVLLRDPDLVITYSEIEANRDADIGTAGVFKADKDSNELLRKAEPAAHDAWNEAHQDWDVKRRVKAVFLNIKRFISEEVNPTNDDKEVTKPSDNSHASLISKHIGNLIWSELTSGAGQKKTSRPGGISGGGISGAGRKSAPLISKPVLKLHGTEPSINWRITFNKTTSSKSTTWDIELQLASGDGNSYETLDSNSELPYFLKNIDSKISRVNNQLIQYMQSEKEETIEVEAIVEKGTMITIEVRRIENNL